MSRIELLPGRSRYNLVGRQPSWVYHKIASAGLNTLAGGRPVTATESNPDLVAPSIVRGGYAEFTELTDGGLFYHLAKNKLPLVIYSMDLSNAGTITSIQTVSFSDPLVVLRDIQPLVALNIPFTVASGEMIQVISAGKVVGVLASQVLPDLGAYV